MAPPACWSPPAPKAVANTASVNAGRPSGFAEHASRICVSRCRASALRWHGPAPATSPRCARRCNPCASGSPSPRDRGLPVRCPRMADRSKSTPLAWVGQALLYGLFALVIGVFSRWPPYHHLQPDQALIKLSFSHQGKPVSDCRNATPEELASLPPNMRAPRICPRERSPIAVELDLDGVTALRHVALPSGLSRDGASAFYHRM